MKKLKKKLRVGALISGGGTNLQAIIDACEKETIPARIVFVGSDRPSARGLERAEKHNIPGFVTDYKKLIRGCKDDPASALLPDDFDLPDMLSKQSLFPKNSDPERVRLFLESRAICEAALLKQMARFPFDLIVLAGFMRTLSPYFIDRIDSRHELPRIMNIHPALLPAFPGVDGYGDTFRYGCKVGGCTVHFIDYGEDTGPIIGQRAFDILPGDTLESVKKKGLEQEWKLYPECISLYAHGRLAAVKKTYSSGGETNKTRTIVEILPVAM